MRIVWARYAKHLLIIGGMLLWYFWPLFDYQQNIVGFPGDPYAHAAQAEWFCNNFFQGDFFNEDLLVPYGVDQRLGYDMPLLYSLSCPFQRWGPVMMLNVITMIQVGLIMGFSYLLVRMLCTHEVSRIGFVLLYGFSAFYMARVNQHISLLSTIWAVPAVLYGLIRLDFVDIKKTLLAGGLVGVSLASAWQNAPNLFGVVVILGGWQVWQYKDRGWKNWLLHAGAGMVVLTVVSSPFVWPAVSAYGTTERVADTKALGQFNADVLSYVMPWREHIFSPWFEGLRRALVRSGRSSVAELYNSLDPVTWGLWIWLLLKTIRKHMAWSQLEKVLLLMAGLYFWLSLGPKLTIGGKMIAELPYYWQLSKVPPFSMTRTPARLGIVFVAVMMLVAFMKLDKYVAQAGFDTLKGKVFLIVGFGIVWATLLNNNLRIPTYNYGQTLPWQGLARIRQDSRSVNVLHIPMALLTDASQNLLQSYHKKPISAGYISYAVLNTELKTLLSQDSLAYYLECSQSPIKTASGEERRSNSVFSNEEQFLTLLTNRDYGYILVNHSILQHERCAELADWTVRTLSGFERIELIDWTPSYSVYAISVIVRENR